MSVHVLAPGLLATVQDGGRQGYRHLGVGLAGAADPWSHALANLLVGNAPAAAALEITLSGPRLRLDAGARLALCGARIAATIEGRDIPMDRPVDVPAGSVLQLGACRAGARTYLAIRGGFAVPALLGSCATDLRGGFGGMRGRALAAGDVLPLARRDACAPAAVRAAAWWVDAAPQDAPRGPVRVIAGEAGTVPHNGLFAHAWRVAAASNRQGLRLEGPPLRAADARERTSEPVFPGTVQLPSDGQPIALLADAQTHGGYPRIGHAIRADWPLLAQLRPGDTLRFAPCSRDEALHAARTQRQRLARLALAIRARG